MEGGNYLNLMHFNITSYWGGGEERGGGGGGGAPLAIVWESLKKEKKKSMLFLIKINLVFFSVISQLLESIYCPHFPPQTSGLCKKVHVSGPIREGGECCHGDVIGNRSSALWLTERESGLKRKTQTAEALIQKLIWKATLGSYYLWPTSFINCNFSQPGNSKMLKKLQ